MCGLQSDASLNRNSMGHQRVTSRGAGADLPQRCGRAGPQLDQRPRAVSLPDRQIEPLDADLDARVRHVCARVDRAAHCERRAGRAECGGPLERSKPALPGLPGGHHASGYTRKLSHDQRSLISSQHSIDERQQACESEPSVESK